MDITLYLKERKVLVDRALAAYCDRWDHSPPRLAEAMRYSLMAGGKRLRPILAMAGAAAVGGSETAILPCACALEMIHTFSLIHDDLPAMDNDDLRRGVPTNHKVYGEAMAILSGDGLLAAAFRCLAHPEVGRVFPPERIIEVIGDIAEATGSHGMVGGQVLDIANEGHTVRAEGVLKVHRYKTGALIRVAVMSGAKLVGADCDQLESLTTYGDDVGLAFQIADDLLGAEGAEAEIGKPVGSDAARGKATYPAMVGITAARKEMAALVDRAILALDRFGERAEPLRLLAQYTTHRRS